MELNIKDLIVNLLTNSETTVNKLYQFVNGKDATPTKVEFDKFRKDLINSVKHKKENALELFPIIKYFESKRLTEDDLATDETLFTFPTEERIAIASPIQVLDDIPEKSEYDQKFEWDLVDIDERESLVNKAVWNYFEIIKDQENIKRAVLSWGRYVEEHMYLTNVERELFAEDVPQEVFSLNQSDNLNSLLPTEIAQLDDPDLEFIFYKNFIEKKLLAYQLWGIEREILQDIEITKKDLDDKGPLFLCIDTSGSMRGIVEVISKALALATVHILDQLGMRVVLIPFSTRARPLDLFDAKNKVKAARNWLSKSYYGGSDINQLLDVLSSFMSNKKYAKANIVVFSDFIFKNIDPSIKVKIEKIKERSHSFHSLKISKISNKNSIENLFSSNWSYVFNFKGNDEDLTDDDLIRQLTEANISARNSLEEITSFGFIKKIKDFDYARKMEERNSRKDDMIKEDIIEQIEAQE